MRSNSKLLELVARKSVPLSVLLVAMLVAYLATSSLLEAIRPSGTGTPSAESPGSDTPTNPFSSVDGTHLIAFVITASDCGWSSQTRTMEALGSIRERMQSAHGARYAHVGVVGVAIDEEPETGLTFLSEIAGGKVRTAFDQIAIGGSWLNEHLVRFVWREGIAEAATPQVILVERPVDTKSYLSDYTIRTGDDKVVATLSGSSAILQWLVEGLPLDDVNDDRRGGLPRGSLAP